MRKKIALCLGMIAMMVMMLCACGTDPKAVDYNGYSYDELYSTSLNTVQVLAELTDENRAYIMQSGTELDQEIVNAWDAVLPEVGEYKEYKDFSITKSGDTLTTDLILVFENREATFEMVFKYHSMELTGVTIEPVYSLGEKMSKAGMNTLISMSVVFAVLILISLIIYCFNIFPYLEKKKKEKNQTTVAEQPKETVEVVPEVVEPVTDDTELIAVIAAAIAASTGTSTSDFVVRSINRR
ncbi:MAG: OadG family protein [Agathobacter sp.]|nr:OadG family protein [Agathobacter sp.]MBQ2283426.1 OadG family protein [Agathobacter sp.]